MDMYNLIVRLVKAAKAGECSAPGCPICKEKWDTIKEAEDYIEECIGKVGRELAK